MSTIIKEIDFKEVLFFWENFLWKGRKSKITPTHAMGYKRGTFNLQDPRPVFFGAFYDNQCVGVNSCYSTNEFEFRSRGLWVNPTHRGLGISKKLLKAAIDHASSCQGEMIWSMPRESALYAYLSVGFEKTSDFFDEGVEFGPNCYVRMTL